MDENVGIRHERTGHSAHRVGTRAARLMAAAAVVLALGACDALPGDRPTEPAPSAEPMDPTAVAEAETTAVDPSWLCDPGGDADAPEHAAGPGVLSAESVRTDGNDIVVSGPFQLQDGYSYGGFVPEAVVVPADPANRGAPGEGYDEMGTDGAPTPPIVARERVEIPGEGAAPSAVTARLTLGTCDDAPLPDGQYLLALSGGGIDGPDRGEDDAGWSTSDDVLFDVVDGSPQPVPGAATAPEGEIPADLSSLGCRSPLEPVGDGDGLSVTVSDQETSVPAAVPEDQLGAGIDAEVTVRSEDLGTRALLQGVVLTAPESGTVVAGARNAGDIGLQWIGEEDVTTSETAWTTRMTCTRSALQAGPYDAHAFAVTVDEEGATHVVLSDPWTVEVAEADAGS
ncbi:hypothetical protein ACFQRD_13925 [Brachybacterium sp. GCM10030268]|uniref:hypothetical protein n=1 Tax=Brachybacterium sp. GCM10030268 TaxID=3273382 RepID=UPI003609273F